MTISGTALPPRRLRREADSASATYTVNPRYSRALCSQVRLLARSIRNPQIKARSCSRPFTDTCRAASNSSRPTRSERRPKQARPGPCLGSHSVRGCPLLSLAAATVAHSLCFSVGIKCHPHQGSAEVLSGVPRRRKAGMCLMRKTDVR